MRTLPGSPFFEITKNAEMHIPPSGTAFILGGAASFAKAASLRSVVNGSSALFAQVLVTGAAALSFFKNERIPSTLARIITFT